MHDPHAISPDQLTFDQMKALASGAHSIELSATAVQKITACRQYLDETLANSDQPFYGINTGFGDLADKQITKAELEVLQQNLVMSHACGTGDEVPLEIVKLMLLLKVQSLSYGHSGVQLVTVQRLVDLFNSDILPVVYQQGSLGASGDLAPLAHLCLPLLGMGEVNHKGKRTEAAEALDSLGWQPLQLQSKEGLALLNGTQFMSAYGIWCLVQADRLMQQADLISALSLDAWDCKLEPFNDLIHQVRPHKGQRETAANILQLLKDSEIANRTKPKDQVQDPYSFRCIPQVHGACKDALAHVRKVFMTEVNSVTDNPNVFPQEGLILSGGNFHGEPLALALDYACMALSELGNISERRIYKLISGKRDLPAFLVSNPGVNSGFMIPQYTAAAIVSQNKQLSTPASVDSITSSNGQEDHVSMGANAATKAYQVVLNLERILAIELLNAAQAFEFRKKNLSLKSSPAIEDFYAQYREVVSFYKADRYMHEDIEKTIEFLRG